MKMKPTPMMSTASRVFSLKETTRVGTENSSTHEADEL
jgi:hypothetical protein